MEAFPKRKVSSTNNEWEIGDEEDLTEMHFHSLLDLDAITNLLKPSTISINKEGERGSA